MIVALASLLIGWSSDFSKAPELASVNPDTHVAANGSCGKTSLAKNGRLVFFDSTATTLDASDTTPDRDVYVRDRKTNSLDVLELADGDQDVNGDCFLISASADGRYVAFLSSATTVIPGFGNGLPQMYVVDRKLHHTMLASASASNIPIAGEVVDGALSASGRYAVFTTSAPNVITGMYNFHVQVYLRDLVAGETDLISMTTSGPISSEDCHAPRVSSDGRYAFFVSAAANLVVGDNNSSSDIFVRDRLLETLSRVSVGPSGEELDKGAVAVEITPNAKTIAFISSSDVLGDGGVADGVYVRKLATGAVVPAALTTGGTVGGGDSGKQLAISKNGRYVLFATKAGSILPGDQDAPFEHAVYCDLKKHKVEIATKALSGAAIDADILAMSLSANGKTIAFSSSSSNLTTVPTSGNREAFVRTR